MPLDEKWFGEAEYSPQASELDPVRAEAKKDYSEYLRSEHWQERRSSAIEAAYRRCEWCGKSHNKLQVHHKHYHTLGMENLDDLLVLCPRCHMKTYNK